MIGHIKSGQYWKNIARAILKKYCPPHKARGIHDFILATKSSVWIIIHNIYTVFTYLNTLSHCLAIRIPESVSTVELYATCTTSRHVHQRWGKHGFCFIKNLIKNRNRSSIHLAFWLRLRYVVRFAWTEVLWRIIFVNLVCFYLQYI